MPRALHHLELWVEDLDRAGEEWAWLLGELGWSDDGRWGTGRSWSHDDGTYLFMESSADVRREGFDRMRPGINHLALLAGDRALLDRIRAASTEHGWHELFTDRYPHAGGPDHVALYLEDGAGFEIEVVLDPS